MNLGSLSSFLNLVGTDFVMIPQSLTVFLGALTIFVKFVEKHLVMKVWKHERLVALIETEACVIKHYDFKGSG